MKFPEMAQKLKELAEMLDSGKPIQWRNGVTWHTWHSWTSDAITAFNVSGFLEGTLDIRIKPEPREWYELEYPDGRGVSEERYRTREAAEARREFTVYGEKVKITKVREVLE